MSDHFSNNAPDPVGPYPHAKRVGQWLYLSGVGPRTPDGNDIPGNVLTDEGELQSYDFEAQAHSVFKNIESILKDSGAGLSDLVDVTVFLTNMKDDFQTMNKVYAQYLGEHQPCRTTVEVTALPTEIAIELKCIARLKKADTA
ncbi:MAG TPA: RidA family protein [Xanthomonadales bacterium]|nr:RidA family protein [Xanthomonadales bacterium]